MKPAGEISFRRLGGGDWPLLEAWLEAPHVQAWWGEPEEELALIREGEDTGTSEGYIAALEGEDVAYVQSWRPQADASNAWGVWIGPDVAGMDIFIGPERWTGRGLGPHIVRAFALRLCAAGARRVLMDPDTANRWAIRAYSRAGFRPVAVIGHTQIMIFEDKDTP